jgi:nucleotide-binding universal stress UspA family protein
MLVVGSRGLGGFGDLVLGSVSDKCVRYAACPVLVARQRR